MEQYEIDLINIAFGRCYGLQNIVKKSQPNDLMFKVCVDTLAFQSGLREKFIIDNINEIKKIA